MIFQISYFPTISADRQKPYLLVRVNGMQMIDAAWRDEVAKFLGHQLGTKIVLVGQMPNRDWHVYGEPSLVWEAKRAPLESVPWRTATLTIPDPETDLMPLSQKDETPIDPPVEKKESS